MNLFNLEHRRILITGSGSGLGLGMARGLAQHGATVILNGRNPDRLEQASQALRSEGLEVETCPFDATDEDAVQAAVARLLKRGPLHVLVNNAGIQRRGPLEHVTLDTWNEVLTTNLTSPLLMARALMPHMRAAGGGKIINVCSLMSEVGRAGTGPYTAAKGGLKLLTRAMCAEWAEHNIQVNGIGPGYFRTDMTRALVEDPEFNAWVVKRTPARRWGEPQDLTGAAVFLSSDASSFVNGQVIYVDGGILSVL